MQAPEPSSRKQDIVRQVLQRKTPQERAAFLDGACGDDAVLRVEVEALLAGKEENQGTSPLNAGAAGIRIEDGATELTPTLLDETTVTEGPGTLIGRYKLLEQIGEGGFGVVYVAEQREPVKRQVAMKIIKLGMDTRQVVARFEAERQALAMMAHPNIAKVFDAGSTDTGRPFFVMELVKGVPITRYCDREKLSTQNRLKLFIAVCQAIQHAHQKGIIHRDIKPSNILVTLQEGLPVPKVIDFGIAKATQQQLTEKTLHTQLQQFIGTPAYMSPEQAEMSGSDIDTRSDIYSLGVLLYELLVGKTPFDSKELLAAGLDEIRRTIREKEPARPSTRLSLMGKEELTTTTQHRGAEASKLISLLRGDLDWIVMKCLEKDRTRRYETANALAMDLQRHLRYEPVIARPPSVTYKFQKLVRRNKLAFAAAGTVALVLVLGIVASTWQATRAEQERNTARHNAYAASMLLAQADWDNNNIGHLRQMLAETQDYPERGFEWYYWQRLCHLELRTLYGHLDEIWCIAVSPDGQRIVTGSKDKTAKVWETSTGRELLTLKGHKHAVASAAFSPDGQWIATGSFDRTAKVWEASTGREVRQLTGHTAIVWSVTFSSDGQWILTTSSDQTAKLWEVGTWREVRTLTGHTAGSRRAAFSPDGRWIVTASEDRTAKVWETSTGRELLTLEGHTADVFCGSFSPDGQRIVTGSKDNTVRIWETSTGINLKILKGHVAGVWSACFFPDGQRIVTGSEDGTARVWDASTGVQLGEIKGHLSGVSGASVTADGQRLVTGSRDGTAKLWEAGAGPELLTITGHTHKVRSAAFSPDGLRILTGGDDQTAKLWEAGSGRELLTLKGHTGNILSVGFSSDGQRIVTGGEDNTAKVWDAKANRELFTLRGHRGWVRSAAFSLDGQWIVTGSVDRTAKLWDARTGLERRALVGHRGPVFSVGFSPDGRWLVTGSGDRMAKLWQVSTGEELRTLSGHSGQIFSVAVSPDGLRIATGSEDQSVKLWDAGSGHQTLITLQGHTGPIYGLAFSPDGQRIVTGSVDQTAKVFEASTGRGLLTLKGHSAPIVSAAFSPDGSRIVTASLDNTAKVWAKASQDQVAAWQEAERLAENRLNALAHERAQDKESQRTARANDEGAIKQWLVLAPIPLAQGESGAQGLDRQQLPEEAQLRPQGGKRALINDKSFAWDEVHLTDYVVDFNQLLGEEKDFSVAYAVCYIVADEEKTGLLMKMGCDDEAKVYLNGQQVLQRRYLTSFIADDFEDRTIRLNQGINVLVFKVVNEEADWQGSIRLTDKDGNPVKGIKVTLNPEAKD